MAKVSRDQCEVVVHSGGSDERVIIANSEPSIAEITPNDPKLMGDSSCHRQDGYPTQKRPKDP